MADIGKRIRLRREELGMTQEELANKLGYKNKTTITKIESGKNDIVQSKVAAFAEALQTTVPYLMGWEDSIESKKETLTPAPNTLAAHFDGTEYTEDELEEIKQFAAFVKSKRGKE